MILVLLRCYMLGRLPKLRMTSAMDHYRIECFCAFLGGKVGTDPDE